ncbi:MAG: hypothetical protein JWQ23_184 [Herminiimonas sp.]|nr:hypothetical protein [Herminiimonas sp.]
MPTRYPDYLSSGSMPYSKRSFAAWIISSISVCLAILMWPQPSVGQVPPNAEQPARYAGMHAAAR